MRVVSQLYPSYTEAERVVRALEAAGVPERDITLISGEKRTASGTPATGTGQATETGAGTGATLGGVLGGGAGLLAGLGSLAIPGVGPVVAAGWLVATLAGVGVGAAAGGLLGALTGAGISEAEARTYAQGINEGRTLVSVRVEGDAARVENILKGASTAGFGTTATPQAAGTRVGAAETIKVVREDIAVGKREVERGGVRVTSHVVETPVEERVTLHDETVRVERRPVDQRLSAVSPDAFQERVIEVRAVGEEAVVAKEARVVEEIGIHKQATDRVETVRDTVRETKVEVEGDTTQTGRPAPKGDPLPPKR